MNTAWHVLRRGPTWQDGRVFADWARWKAAGPGRATSRRTRVRRFRIHGVELEIADFAASGAPEIDYFELRNDEYGIDSIDFADGDTLVDIGGNVGMVAIYAARRHPGIRVLSYEPIRDNHDHFVQNLERNGVTNVRLFHRAVTGDGRELEMTVHASNSGGATAQVRDLEMNDHLRSRVGSTTLDEIFREHRLERARLLKIDCEGSEHEVLRAATCLDRVDYLSGEFHVNGLLESQGHSIQGLTDHCARFIERDRIRVKPCRMAE
ncbi:MAG: hypothetical protein DHS20C21_10730 [Gemmatimonadota bacterium]|nr:MAG: hypothetical protein DHS20C21_10730 [Gemmatimonadota bacterium]